MATFISLPTEVVLLLIECLHNIEDYVNLSSTCRTMRLALGSATPNTILRLAAAQSRIFFRPSPEFLVAATARELGNWARLSDANEATLVTSCQAGVEGVLDLALQQCGLTLPYIRKLHAMRFSIFNPVTDIIDRCVGQQWYSTPDFWDGGVDDAYTIRADPSSTLFHLAIYGELFGPDLAKYIEGHESWSSHRSLKVETRLEFIKYCLPDFACELMGDVNSSQSQNGIIDPRRDVKPVGPYAKSVGGTSYETWPNDNNLALVWVLQSTRWRPHWKRVRQKAGVDFQEDFQDTWWFDEEDESDWRQRLWENVMVCQGLEGLAMIMPELQDAWLERIQEWRTKIAALDLEPETIRVVRQGTHDYPFLLGDLRICVSGFVSGT
ncbi:hypothetical protein BGZ63DRAFT_388106 [Mariannaea sp. PMI_226]|nr:hypothetical protein BGZ63DRAFT_388106 [Mariannaea sp. PMI_226]